MTVHDLIHQAFRLAGVIQLAGRDASDDEYTEALFMLNALTDAWSANGLLISGIERKVVDLTPGKNSYTMGPGGDWNFRRPAKIEAADTIVGTPIFEQQVHVNTAKQWAALMNKGEISNFGPTDLYMENISPLANVLICPMALNSMQMTLYVWGSIGSFSSADEDLSGLTPGYLQLLLHQLAVELSLAPRFRRAPMDPLVVQTAQTALAELIKLNAQVNYGLPTVPVEPVEAPSK